MSWSQDVYTRAWKYATRAHLGQLLPGSEWPYINHVGNVAMEVMAAIAIHPVEAPDLAVQCALLHDVIEDTGTTYEQVESEFGREVADGVLALSKDKALPKREQLRDSLDRVLRQPREVWMVKLADRVTNLQPPMPGHWTSDKIRSYRDEAIEIHQALSSSHPVLASRLADKIEEFQVYLDHRSPAQSSPPAAGPPPASSPAED